jgi:hypothetical protein
VSTRWLVPLKVDELRALCWHYAALAKGVEAQLPRRVDPRKLTKNDLIVHIRSHIKDIVRPDPAALSDMVTMFDALSNQDVLAVLDNTQAPSSPIPIHHNEEKKAGNPDHEGHVTPPRSDKNKPSKKRQRSPDTEEEGGSSAGNSAGSPSSGEQDRPSRRPSKRRGGVTLVLSCPAPTCKNVALAESVPNFCNVCGAAWGKATTPSTATPKTWKLLDHHIYKPLSEITAPPLHITTLGRVPELTIKRAREGTQHYTISDLLAPLADDRAIAAVDEDLVFIANDTGTLSRASGTRASEARRPRRAVTSLSDIIEVFVFTLIPVIYKGRPDIGEQLYMLLTRAVDICRNHNGDWNMALQYVDGVRRAYWERVQKDTHVLEINTTVDLGAHDLEAYVTLLPRSTTPARGPSGTVAGGGRAQGGGGKSLDNPHKACLDWNKGTCKRMNCKFPHICQSCAGPHPRTHCSPQQPQQTPVTPRTPTSRTGAQGGT